MQKIGIIAGGGRLPSIFAREARRRGDKVIGFAIKEMTDTDFGKSCDRVHRFGIGEFKKGLIFFAMERIKKIVMLGKVDKSVIYSNIKKDKKASEFLDTTAEKSDYALLDRITSELAKRGVEVIDPAEYLSALFPPGGVLTERPPAGGIKEDMEFGYKVARELARFDIGQTVVVKDKFVVSVEALEGTGPTIERASSLCGSGFTVVKVARPNQDMRWDIPVVGPDTLELIARKKGNAIALEKRKIFLIDKETCLGIAGRNNISIVVL